MLIMDDSEFIEKQIQRSLGLNRLNLLDSQFVANATKATQKMDWKHEDAYNKVMRSVIKNFHKKPLQERLNQVINLISNLKF